jgi:hypothetical protein
MKGTTGTTNVCPGQAAQEPRHSKPRASIGITHLATNAANVFRVQAAQLPPDRERRAVNATSRSNAAD